jgi:hypothetical protein
MFKRYVVVDQNIFRKEILKELIASSPATQFVVPDLAFLEMTKAKQWEETLRSNFTILSTARSRVVVSQSVGDALKTELVKRAPIGKQMLDHEATGFVRGILQSINDGSICHEIERIRMDPENHRDALAKDHLDHDRNKAQLDGLIDATKSMLPKEFTKRLRAKKVGPDERLDVIFQVATGLLPGILFDAGFTRDKARILMKQKPMLIRYMYLKAWQCLNWIEMGGFENLSSNKVTNDELDHEYILTATFFHDLLSEELRVNQAYKDLLVLIKRKI